MNTPLSTFPAPLLRLILCGGKGLAPAWGPLLRNSQVRWAWDPGRRCVQMYDDQPDGVTRWVMNPTFDQNGWSLPLDSDGPWSARLALVAAWMASAWMPADVSAEMVLGEYWLHLYTYSGGVADIRAWACNDGGNIEPGAVRLDLPTLPQHLQTHPPVVALLLALYDVPEIRARMKAPDLRA